MFPDPPPADEDFAWNGTKGAGRIAIFVCALSTVLMLIALGTFFV